MFEFLRKKSIRELATQSWENADSTYAADLRSQLEIIASRIFYVSRAKGIFVGYNRQRKSAEFVTDAGEVVARVCVTGECGVPGEAIVTTNFPDEHKGLFNPLFPKQPERIKFKSFPC